MELPFVSIIIPTYSDWGRLNMCIGALKLQTYPHHLFEVVIINNNSSDEKIPDLSLPKNVSIINESEPGSYAARNRGILHSKGDILGFTDSDCIPEKNWIENAVHQFNKNSEIARVAGCVELFLSEKKDTPASLYDRTFSFRQEIHAESGTSVTANMFSRKEIFNDIGLFNSVRKSGADKEWGARADAAGFSIIYAPEVVVHHPLRRELAQIVKKARRVYGGQFVEKGWDSNNKLTNFFCSIYAFRPPFKALSVIFFKKELSFKERFQVLKVLCRVRLYLLLEHLQLTFGKRTER